jgi:hypothetical protein
MALSGHKTIFVSKRYNLVPEEELAGIKWPTQRSVGKEKSDSNQATHALWLDWGLHLPQFGPTYKVDDYQQRASGRLLRNKGRVVSDPAFAIRQLGMVTSFFLNPQRPTNPEAGEI